MPGADDTFRDAEALLALTLDDDAPMEEVDAAAKKLEGSLSSFIAEEKERIDTFTEAIDTATRNFWAGR